MCFNLNRASWNHIACMLDYDAISGVVQHLNTTARRAVHDLRFSGTKLSARAEDRAAILIAETFMTHQRPEAVAIQREIQEMRQRQLQVLTSPKHLFLMDDGVIQLGMRDLDVGGRRPFTQQAVEFEGEIAGWKGAVRERRTRKGWEENREHLEGELAELTRLNHIIGRKRILFPVHWLMEFKASVPDVSTPKKVLKQIHLIETIRNGVFFRGFPRVDLASAVEMRILAQRIRRLWLSLPHAPLSVLRSYRLRNVLDALPLGNLSETSKQMLGPYFSVITQTRGGEQYMAAVRQNLEIACAVRGGYLRPLKELIRVCASGTKIETIDRSQLLGALLQRKEYRLLRVLNRVMFLCGDISSLLLIALKENWSFEEIQRLTQENTGFGERIGIIVALIRRNRLDVAGYLIERDGGGLSMLFHVKDHPQFAFILNLFREHWRQPKPKIYPGEDQILWSLREYIRVQRAEASEDQVLRWEGAGIAMDHLIQQLQARRMVDDVRLPIRTKVELERFIYEALHGRPLA